MTLLVARLSRVPQEERSIFWEVIVLFRTVSEIELFYCAVPKLLIGMRYCVLYLTPEFIVEVTKLVQFTYYNTFSKIPPSTSMHFATSVKTWCIALLYSVHCTVQ
jgi:hypothetical protein